MIRTWLHKRIARLHGVSWVLLYHRVAKAEIDPWDLCVTPARFEEQLKWLKQQVRILSLSELVEGCRADRSRGNCVALTFDDGYADNYLAARPLLEQYEVPATFFIATGPVQTGLPFWWDELQALVLEKAELPGLFSAVIEGEKIVVDMAGERIMHAALWTQLSNWKGTEPPATGRALLYVRLWEKLKFMDPVARQASMEMLRAWAGGGIPPVPPVMNAQQLEALAANPLFELGGHTVTHPALATLDKRRQLEEVRNGMAFLSRLTGRGIRFFSYPYGNFNHVTTEIARREGLRAAFTTEERPVGKLNRAGPYAIGRKCVTNDWQTFKFLP